MNLKPFAAIKLLFSALVAVSVCLVTIYIFIQRNADYKQSQLDIMRNMQVNMFKQLLPEHKWTALIQKIVDNSFKNLLRRQKLIETTESPTIALFRSESVTKTNKINSDILQRLFHYSTNLSANHLIRVSQLQAFQIQVTLEERQMMYGLLELFDTITKKHNISYFMYGGTLLGSFRHHDLIPWDDDLDVIVSAENYLKLEDIFKPLLPNYTLHRGGGHHKLYHKSAKKASVYDWLWPYLDISYYEENATHIKDNVKTYDEWHYFPKAIVFPLHNRPLFNLSLPAPKDTFAFLTWRFGIGSPCFSKGYSHMVETSFIAHQADCQSQAHKFPFVEHLPHKNGVREVLKYKDWEITDYVVPEPRYAVSETFQLSLKPGYKMPSKITPPPV